MRLDFKYGITSQYTGVLRLGEISRKYRNYYRPIAADVVSCHQVM